MYEIIAKGILLELIVLGSSTMVFKPSLYTLTGLKPESKKPVIVNYRYQNNKFIVDAVFDKAILISGVGSKQKKITLIFFSTFDLSIISNT